MKETTKVTLMIHSYDGLNVGDADGIDDRNNGEDDKGVLKVHMMA